ncbi:M48 family metalloprotease [Marinilongibacter aquaticus]|uniref:M48 family metalloprotease n=1 Tax=Marinilongibacter aquaticus TaxID=2975157 RepID=UPI0021BDDB95|nr:M48 family metalloprotease [Marinilongibacter aquaticus]UBM57859.1 M48 family metalloprotease [Marinilongibacter aquaticus]
MRRSGGFGIRLIIGLVMAVIALIGYFGKTQVNPITGEKQQVAMSPEQEVAMGLQSAPRMAQEYGGLYPDHEVQSKVKTVGQGLVKRLNAHLSAEGVNNPYQFDFHVLRDPQTVNAFALPGGQVFITMGLLSQLQSVDQLAGVLGHEIGHVVHRHSAQQMAKGEFFQGLAGAATAASGDYSTAQVANYVAQIKMMKYGREDELQSDEFGVQTMISSGYNPQAMIEVMEILAKASGGGMNRDEFMSSHPNPANRIEHIKEAIRKYSK